MRSLPLLAALLFSSPIAGASTELELLQDRCAEQERQIRQLEEENSRLKSLVDTAAATPVARSSADREAPAPALSDKVTTPPPAGPSHATVQKGDTLSKVAKRHGTTPEALIKLNQLKDPSLIRPGQKLLLPAKSAPAPAPRPSSGVGGIHVVQQGETYYSIARKHGLSMEALEAANPTVKATALQPGQRLQLARSSATTAAAKETSLAKAAPPAAPVARPELPAATASPVTKLDTATPPPAPLEAARRTVSSAPRIKSVLVTEEIDFGAFAAAHGTTTEKLNALNGHLLKPNTVLAKGSEFYVPAQP
jgi:LysM repeat protein